MSIVDPIVFDSDTIEQAVALCVGLGNKGVSAYVSAVYPLAYDDVEARIDLGRAAFHEVYKRRTPCWLYFAAVGDSLVKVGRSTDVPTRIAKLTSQHMIEHRLLGTVRGDYREERRVHSHFRKHRVRNLEDRSREYYRIDPVRPTIDAILAAGHLIELPYKALP